MSTLAEKNISKALFISPIVNMEKLITEMMMWSNVMEDELQSKMEIPTEFGATLQMSRCSFLMIGFAVLENSIYFYSKKVIQQKWSRKFQLHSCKMIALRGEKMQEQIEAVQRMQEYIKKHLRENISFADVAKISLFSPWYARRLFLEYTGVTPSEYIRKLRLHRFHTGTTS